jgi:hypothetical protein
MRFRHSDISILLLLLIASLSWVDVITTGYGLQNGYQELNQFIAPYVGDPVIFLLIKAVGILLILLLALCSRCIHRKGDHILLGTVCGITCIPAFWNISILYPLILLL